MPELIEAYWPFLLIAFVIGLVIAWLVFRSSRTTTVVGEERGDVLDEGADRAKRNQALIDTPPAAGELSSVANTREVAAAPAPADAEAGPDITPTHSAPPELEEDAAPDDPEAAPAPAPEPAAAPTPDPSLAHPSAVGADDLTRIKGLGPKLSATLKESGITSFAQIAAWSEADIDRVDSQLGRFQGRIRRDNWVEQAKLLAAGEEAGFKDRFGNEG